MTCVPFMWTSLAALWSFSLLFCCYCEGAKHSKKPAKNGVEGLTLVLQHAIGGGDFVERGVASIRSLKSSSVTMSISQDQLSQTQLEDIEAAAVKGEVYRLRAPNRLREGLEEQSFGELQFVSTAISACALVQSQLSDVIKVTGDGRGNIIGLALTTPPGPPPIDCSTCSTSGPPWMALPRSFNTSITLDNGTPPPAPDVQMFLEKKEIEEKEEREKRKRQLQNDIYFQIFCIGVFLVFFNAGRAAGGGRGT